MRLVRVWSGMGIGVLGMRRGWGWSDWVLGRTALEASGVYMAIWASCVSAYMCMSMAFGAILVVECKKLSE